MGTPRGQAPLDIKKQWRDIVIPFDTINYLGKETSMPKILTNGTYATAALGLSLIKDIKGGYKDRSEIDTLYRAFVYWTDFDRATGSNTTFSFIPKIEKS